MIKESFCYKNLDNISFLILILLLLSAIFMPSDIMGIVALLFSGVVILKTLIDKSLPNLELYEKALLIYFLIVTVSLFASTLFSLSLHGYIKTLIYILFYFCAAQFFRFNKDKILPLIIFVSILMTFESFIAIWQNYHGIDEISLWQDTTNLNPEDIVSRAYGTLKPYNPNLLAGYLLCGLSSFIYLILKFLEKNKKTLSFIFSILFFINLLAIIDTGCRGAYLGFMLFFPCLFVLLFIYAKDKITIKKNHKLILSGGFLAFLTSIFTNPAIIKRFQSILALRADSSISFRLNVYEASWRMFLDNPIFGIGVGNQNFREIYGLYMKTGYDALGAYCVPLEIALESGIFALIAFVLFLIFVLKKCFNMIKTMNPDYKILACTVILMIFATMGHGFFDTIWFRPQVQFLFWIYIAMLKNYPNTKPT